MPDPMRLVGDVYEWSTPPPRDVFDILIGEFYAGIFFDFRVGLGLFFGHGWGGGLALC